MFEEKCIEIEECLAKPRLIVYSPKAVAGSCTEPFECVKGVRSSNGHGCKCPKAMVGCEACTYSKTWGDRVSEFGSERMMLSGPACTRCNIVLRIDVMLLGIFFVIAY